MVNLVTSSVVDESNLLIQKSKYACFWINDCTLLDTTKLAPHAVDFISAEQFNFNHLLVNHITFFILNHK